MVENNEDIVWVYVGKTANLFKKNYEKWLINGFIDDLPIKNGWLMDL